MLTKTRGSERFVFRSHPQKYPKAWSSGNAHRAAPGNRNTGRLVCPGRADSSPQESARPLGLCAPRAPRPGGRRWGPTPRPASAPFSPPPSAVLESFDTTRARWSLGHLGKVTSAFGFLGNRELAPLCRPHRDAVKTSGLNLRKGYFPINCRAVSRGKAAGAGSQGTWL